MQNAHDDWPSKGLLVSLNLIVKYTILYKIGVENWAPSFHGSSIISNLASLLYPIGTKVAFDFDDHIFDQVVKHVKYYAAKLLIEFPSLISGILINQKI